MEYKVLITTSGIGQRLGDLTKYTNKSLVRVGKKPAISYVVEAYPEDTKFVVTIGYFGNQVKDFLELAYPERSFEFVTVDRYQGEGSSLGYSMLQAKDSLQCPFIYHASDTIITESVPLPSKNWIGAYKGEDSSQYASWSEMGDGGLVFNDKGAIDFDYIHIGLVGVNDFTKFWDTLERLFKTDPSDQNLNDCAVIEQLLSEGDEFSISQFNQWLDIGNTTALYNARKDITDHFDNLDKLEESIFIFDNFVIKFFYDEKIVEQRVFRGKQLTGLVPMIQGIKTNFYRYEYVVGDVLSDVAIPNEFGSFLNWAKNNLWKPTSEVTDSEFKKICTEFYSEKTKKRVAQFLKEKNLVDEDHVINGESVPSVEKMISLIDFDWLTTTSQSQFHGDFILDNIVKNNNNFCLIDWRHNFGGLLTSGDVYYDLAKLNHNLTVNHEIINKNLFTVKSVGANGIHCDILRKNNLVECQKELHKFLEKEGYDKKKVVLLTSLIWLNMAPLHHHPFDLFLYYFGKLHLWRSLQGK